MQVTYPSWYTHPQEIREEFSIVRYDYNPDGTLAQVEGLGRGEEKKMRRHYKEETERVENNVTQYEGWCRVELQCFDETIEKMEIGKITALN